MCSTSDLDAIPAAALVLINANVLIYALQENSLQCLMPLERCLRQEVFDVLTSIALAEYCHRRMMQEAQRQGLPGSYPVKGPSQDTALVRQLTRNRLEVDDLLAAELLVVAVEVDDFSEALEFQGTYGLLTNDSLNLATGLRSGLGLLATADQQFDSIPSITIFKPDDLQ